MDTLSVNRRIKNCSETERDDSAQFQQDLLHHHDDSTENATDVFIAVL